MTRPHRRLRRRGTICRQAPYTRRQFEDWMQPLLCSDVAGKQVLELGCGNASLLFHMSAWNPSKLVGVDLGDSVLSARANMQHTGSGNWEIVRADMTTFQSGGYDLVYSIGVLHHLQDPQKGFRAVINNVSPGGRFHCWVYGREGNALVRYTVEPIRLVVSHWPWWLTKYFVATPLVVPYYFYAKLLRALSSAANGRFDSLLRHLPLFEYSRWIAERDFLFFRHVAFDQLVTPTTRFISKQELTRWMLAEPRIDPKSTYIVQRNGNSWKFGGCLRTKDETSAGPG